MIRQVRSALDEMRPGRAQEIERMNRSEIDRMMKSSDSEKWRKEMETKKTVKLYFDWKMSIGEEKFYDNTEASTLLFRARSNTLKLGWRGRFMNTEVACEMCDGGEETLDHFVVECPALQEIRERHGMSGRRIEEVLQFDGDCEVDDTKSFLVEAWRKRKQCVRGEPDRIRD